MHLDATMCKQLRLVSTLCPMDETGHATTERVQTASTAVLDNDLLAESGQDAAQLPGRHDGPPPAIETDGLTKFYGRHRGIEGISLTVEAGEVFGFLGPNGSGKSTTIRVLLDLLRPTGGTALVLGQSPRKAGPELRRRIGYLPGDLALNESMTAELLLQYYASLRGMKSMRAVNALAGRFRLDMSRKIGEYSTGNRQKVGLVQAFMHDPELLILDEPTSGLDPLMQNEFYSLVEERKSKDRTIFLSSHVLPEVERVADRVGIIADGQLRVVEDIHTLKARARRRLELHFSTPVPVAAFRRLFPVRAATANADSTILSLQVEGPIDDVIKAAAKYPTVNVVSHDGDLEEIFLRYYRRPPGAIQKRITVDAAAVPRRRDDTMELKAIVRDDPPPDGAIAEAVVVEPGSVSLEGISDASAAIEQTGESQ